MEKVGMRKIKLVWCQQQKIVLFACKEVFLYTHKTTLHHRSAGAGIRNYNCTCRVSEKSRSKRTTTSSDEKSQIFVKEAKGCSRGANQNHKQSPLVKTTSRSETVKSFPQHQDLVPTSERNQCTRPLKYLWKYSCNDNVFCFEAESKCLGGKRMYVFSDTSSTSSTPGDKTNCQIIQKHQDLTQLTVGGNHGGNHGDTSSVQPCIRLYKPEIRKWTSDSQS